ncbi:MAG TPA: hypothetical protein VME69_08885 [Methylocella sp.]|nr:hypothetical protein [Methylocella sp.]
MKRVALALTLILASIAPCAAESDIIGQTSVIDGDAIVIHGTHIRLWGIDAPDSWQTFFDSMLLPLSSRVSCGCIAK